MIAVRSAKVRCFLALGLVWCIGVLGTVFSRGKEEIKVANVLCNAGFLGTFAVKKGELLSNVSYELRKQLSPNACIEACALRKATLATFSTTNCRCGFAISTEASSFLVRPSVSFAEDHTHLYHLRGNCQASSDIGRLLSENFIGCFWAFVFSRNSTAKTQALTTVNLALHNCFASCFRNRTALVVYIGNKCNCVHASETLLEKRWRINIDDCNALQEEHLLIWRTGLEDPICEKKRFLPPHRDLVALISFPGSGNTWLRHLLEQATGIYTGSVYTDKDMYNKGFLGEMEDSKSGRTLLVKDHIYTDKRISLFDYSSIILLVRSPFKALVAEFNRRKSQNHVGFAKPEDFRSPDWSSYTTTMAGEWLSTIAEVFRSGIPVRMVYYEDLLSHTHEEIEKLLKHIPQAHDAFQTRKHCLDRNQMGEYKRPDRVETTFFSAALINYINYQVKRARTILLKNDCVTCKGIPLYEEESSDREATLGGMDDSRSVGNAVIGALKVHAEN